jgi:hypothetical protein
MLQTIKLLVTLCSRVHAFVIRNTCLLVDICSCIAIYGARSLWDPASGAHEDAGVLECDGMSTDSYWRFGESADPILGISRSSETSVSFHQLTPRRKVPEDSTLLILKGLPSDSHSCERRHCFSHFSKDVSTHNDNKCCHLSETVIININFTLRSSQQMARKRGLSQPQICLVRYQFHRSIVNSDKIYQYKISLIIVSPNLFLLCGFTTKCVE